MRIVVCKKSTTYFLIIMPLLISAALYAEITPELILPIQWSITIPENEIPSLHRLLQEIAMSLTPNDCTQHLAMLQKQITTGDAAISIESLEEILNEIHALEQESQKPQQVHNALQTLSMYLKEKIATRSNGGTNLNITNLTVTNDVQVNHNQSILNDLRVHHNQTVLNDLRVHHNQTVLNDFEVHGNQTVLGSLQVNTAVITPNLIISGTGSTGATGGNIVTNNLEVANDLTVDGESLVIGTSRVGEAIIDTDSSVGRDVTIGRDALITRDARVARAAIIGSETQPQLNEGDILVSNDAFVIGNITTTGNSTPSDMRIKNIHGAVSPNESLDRICELELKKFTFKKSPKKMRNNTQEYHGFIAQDVENIFPNAIKTIPAPNTNFDDNLKEIYTIDYNQLLPDAINAVKALNNKISLQEVTLIALLSRLAQAETRIKEIEALQR